MQRAARVCRVVPRPAVRPVSLHRAAPRRAYATADNSAAPSFSARPAASHAIKGAHRPISPHVSIYRFPLPAIASITTRITGVALTFGAAGVAALSLTDPLGGFQAVEAIKSSAPALVPVAKAVVAFPIVYHYLSGLRHLWWDRTAQGFSMDAMRQSSTLLLALAVLFTLALTFVEI